MAARGLVRLSTNNSILFLCDMQEKFRPSVKFFPQIVQVAKRMVDASNILKIPILATEQYPKGLGRTVAELGLEGKVPILEKMSFSMCTKPVIEHLQSNHPGVNQVILCGIEAHACVYQTTLNLLEKNFAVHLIVDAISSRSNVDRFFALRQLEKAGAMLTTSECALLALLKGADHPKFREVQKLIMQIAPDSDLLQF